MKEHDGQSVKEQIKHFLLSWSFFFFGGGGREWKFILPNHSRGIIDKTLFILPQQKEGKYISSYDGPAILVQIKSIKLGKE